MKNISILLLTSFLFLSFTKGGYEKAMMATIESLQAAQNPSELVKVANKFERIGATEKSEWLPFYYQSYCYVMASTMEADVTKIDAYLDIADANIAKADKLKGDQVETLTLRGFSAMMRISVDPASRGQEYSMKATEYLQQANQLDGNNPRVMLMLGQMQYGTAQFFNTDTTPICEQFKKAYELFQNLEEEPDPIWPSWGEAQASYMLKKCEG